MKVLLGLVSLVALAGCREPYPYPQSTGAGSTTPHEGGTLHVASAFDMGGLDPATTSNPMSSYLEALLFDTSVDFVPGTAEIEPDLAERWEIVDEGRTLRFFLRPDAVFQDGTPVTAADVKESLERMLAPDRGSSGMGGFFDLIGGYADLRAQRTANLAGVVAVDAHTVEIHETETDATALARFALVQASIVPAAHVAKVAAAAFARAPVGSGPGRVSADVYYLAMNTEMPPWNNRALRRAVSFALDREAEVKPTLGVQVPHTTLVPPGIPGYQAHPPWAQRFDLAAARAEMAAAGYPDGLPAPLRVLFAHALRNALLPLVTSLGMSAGALLGGTVLVETIFGWSGMGKLAYDAVNGLDLPVIVGTVIVATARTLAGNLGADLVCAWPDPRLR